MAPQNLEAERELLGSLLAYFTPELLATADKTVSADDFFWTSHGIIFRAIRAVAVVGDHVDALTVGRFLECQHDAAGESFLERAGGQAALHLLVTHAVPHGVGERARMVHEDGEWRRRLRRLYVAVEACHARDERAWLAALEGDAPRLRVIRGERAAG
jgi:replicative DNA helicase